MLFNKKKEGEILTTHVGSLPRNSHLTRLLILQEQEEDVNQEMITHQIKVAIQEVINKQLEAGIDIGNDGEQSRVSFQAYISRYMKGFSGESTRPIPRDWLEFPGYAALMKSRKMLTSTIFNAPQAVSEIEYNNLKEREKWIEFFIQCNNSFKNNFKDCFMTSPSPGIIATTLINSYYNSYEKYVFALAEQMKKEYELIYSKGLLLQIDCPDLAMEKAFFFQNESTKNFQKIMETHIEAINIAVENIPSHRIRLHVCWGNYDGPHTCDISLEHILPILYQTKVGGLSLALANPRHQHEIKLFKQYPLPHSMLFIPGVIDSTTNYIEHPQVVAQRIKGAVRMIGDKERIIASVDCGFSTFAGYEMVAEDVVWSKMKTLKEGAVIANQEL